MRSVIHMPMESRALSLLHLGFSKYGQLIACTGKNPLPLEILPADPSRAREVARCVGHAFEHLPGMRCAIASSIVGTLEDGWMVSAAAAEMVYNDAALVNRICGDGFYERMFARRRELEILEMSRHMMKAPVVVGSAA